jgi:hypothetical protein
LKRAGISLGSVVIIVSASSIAGQKATAELNSSGFLKANFNVPMPTMEDP